VASLKGGLMMSGPMKGGAMKGGFPDGRRDEGRRAEGRRAVGALKGAPSIWFWTLWLSSHVKSVKYNPINLTPSPPTHSNSIP
jgi:hypothetical protein